MLEGTAAERIIEYVDERDLDLVVVSTHGQSGLSKWNLSSVVQKIVNRAFKSLLLVRAFNPDCNSSTDVSYRRILVPLDGSIRAEYVLPFATKLAKAHGAELLLVHAVAQPPMVQQQAMTAEDSELIERFISRNTAEAARYLERLQARLAPQAEIKVLVGPSQADTLLDFAANTNVDLVILSAHGQSGENTRPYGSVVTSFISYGASPLLVIQDLPQDRIRPTQAEVAANKNVSSIGLSKAIAYAQPAFWTY
jgi:nucleotide-binding universal stress UspA family protein